MDASYQDEEEEIPEALQTPEELEEANVVSDNESSEEEANEDSEEGIRNGLNSSSSANGYVSTRAK